MATAQSLSPEATRFTHRFTCPAVAGFNRVLTPGQCEMALTGFGLLVLAAGTRDMARGTAGEGGLVVFGGRCTIRVEDEVYSEIGERKDVFSGLPHTLYLPAHVGYEVQAITDVEIAIAESPSNRKGRPVLITPEKVRSVSLGRGNFSRQAVIILDEKIASEHFFLGEAIVPAGNWGSFPPHRHEFDNPPHELDMEEIYFFRFNPPGGFGIQSIYTDTRDVDVAYTVRNNDTLTIPRGYHPVVNAPGYAMYFLWIMTGVQRGFINHKDPQHSWIQ